MPNEPKKEKEIEELLDESFEKNCKELAEMVAVGLASSQKGALESSDAYKEKIKKQVVDSLEHFKKRVQRGYLVLIEELNRKKK